MTPHELLTYEILALSKSKHPGNAFKEWDLHNVFMDANGGTCLCGKQFIVEHCVLMNRINSNEAIVGNECVKKFFNDKADSAFRVLRNIAKDPTTLVGSHITKCLVDRKYVSQFEADWYQNMRRYKHQDLYPGSARRIAVVNGQVTTMLQKFPKDAVKPSVVHQQTVYLGAFYKGFR